jgi:hypothetical protein
MPVVFDRHFFVREGSSAKNFFRLSRVPFIPGIRLPMDGDRSDDVRCRGAMRLRRFF